MSTSVVPVVVVSLVAASLLVWRLIALKELGRKRDSVDLVEPPTLNVVSSLLAMSYPAKYRRTYGGLKVNERNFARKLLYWSDSCVDTTYFVLCELEHLDRLRGESGILAVGQRRRAIQDFILDHAHSEGGFLQHQSSWATVYATFCAFGALRRLDAAFQDSKHLDHLLGYDWTGRTVEFLKTCRTGNGYGEAEYEVATISDTDAAVRLRMEWLRDQPTPQELSALRSFVLGCLRSVPEGQGFASQPSESEPTMCTSNFALKLLDSIVTQEGRERWQDIDSSAFVKYVLASREGGGFGYGPRHSAGVVYTDFALRALEMLQPGELLEATKRDLNPAAIVDFLKSRYRDGGFSDDGVSPRSAHVTRSALSCFKRLNTKAWYGSAEEWLERISPSAGMLSDVEVFLLSLFDEQSGGFRGYRDPYVFELQDSQVLSGA